MERVAHQLVMDAVDTVGLTPAATSCHVVPRRATSCHVIPASCPLKH